MPTQPQPGAKFFRRLTVWDWTLACAVLLVLVALARHLDVLALSTFPDRCDASQVSAVSLNLEELGLALMKYQDEHATLPPAAVTGADGRRLLSWRVLVLPYLGQENLYRQFHLEEPWNSPQNRRLLHSMPDVYRHLRQRRGDSTTCFQAVTGTGTAFGLPIPKVPSETILLVEAVPAVPWTKPEDVVYDPDGPLPRFGGLFPNRFYAVFADGHLDCLPMATDDQAIRRLVNRTR